MTGGVVNQFHFLLYGLNRLGKMTSRRSVSLMAQIKWQRFGPQAILLHFGEVAGEETFRRGQRIIAALEKRPPRGVTEIVPSFTSLLIEYDPSQISDFPSFVAGLLSLCENAPAQADLISPLKEIPIIYDGPDLLRVAQAHCMQPAEVIALHAAAIYRVYAIGFSPGFPYLGDLNPCLITPRLASPRPWVRTGSVGIGGAHTGIYTVDGPGGWNIIGRTPLKLFDINRKVEDGGEEAIFWLKLGDRIKFQPLAPHEAY